MKNQGSSIKESKEQMSILSLFSVKNLQNTDEILRKVNEGIDINTADSGGRTLLMEATIWKNHKLMKLLLERGANVNEVDERNWSALHFAAQNYDPLAAKILIEAGADLNSSDNYGNTIISTAVLNSAGRGEVITLLINYGADADIKNKSGISALDLAKTISNYNVLQYFE